MKKYEDEYRYIKEFLNDLETEVACKMELNNIDYSAMEELKYKKPIILS